MRHQHIHPRTLSPDQAADLAAEFDEHEFVARVEPICIGPIADGSRSLADAARELHSFAVWLSELERDGWQLVHEAEDSHLELVHSDPSERLYYVAQGEVAGRSSTAKQGTTTYDPELNESA